MVSYRAALKEKAKSGIITLFCKNIPRPIKPALLKLFNYKGDEKMKTSIKIMIGTVIVMVAASQCFAELSTGYTESAIQIDNTPEPGAIMLIAMLLIFKAIRK